MKLIYTKYNPDKKLFTKIGILDYIDSINLILNPLDVSNRIQLAVELPTDSGMGQLWPKEWRPLPCRETVCKKAASVVTS